MLIAVSGGADSTALLLGLHRLAPALGLELHAAHLHHGLRGAAADRDLAFVTALCRRLGVRLTAQRMNARAAMRRRGLSGHDGLRVLRREFLREAARAAGAAWIATAHTADDQLETVLMRLLRGTGLRGLGGMRPRRGPWLKPMLELTRRDLEADLRARGQRWRSDRSNRDPRYFRSRIRHGVIPALLSALRGGQGTRADARAGLARRVGSAARDLREADAVVERRARRLIVRAGRRERARSAIALAALGRAPAAVQRSVVRTLWREVAPRDRGLTHAHLGSLRAIVARPREGARVDLASGRSARITGGELVIARTRARDPRRADGRRAARDGKLHSWSRQRP